MSGLWTNGRSVKPSNERPAKFDDTPRTPTDSGCFNQTRSQRKPYRCCFAPLCFHSTSIHYRARWTLPQNSETAAAATAPTTWTTTTTRGRKRGGTTSTSTSERVLKQYRYLKSLNAFCGVSGIIFFFFSTVRVTGIERRGKRTCERASEQLPERRPDGAEERLASSYSSVSAVLHEVVKLSTLPTSRLMKTKYLVVLAAALPLLRQVSTPTWLNLMFVDSPGTKQLQVRHVREPQTATFINEYLYIPPLRV